MRESKMCLRCEQYVKCDKKLSASGGYIPCDVVNSTEYKVPKVKEGIKC